MGIKTNRFAKAPYPQLICTICSGVLEDPRQCPEEHYYCHLCIVNWIKDNQRCPQCPDSQITEEQLQLAPTSIRKMIGSMLISCENVPCGKVVKLSELDHHLAVDCKFKDEDLNPVEMDLVGSDDEGDSAKRSLEIEIVGEITKKQKIEEAIKSANRINDLEAELERLNADLLESSNVSNNLLEEKSELEEDILKAREKETKYKRASREKTKLVEMLQGKNNQLATKVSESEKRVLELEERISNSSKSNDALRDANKILVESKVILEEKVLKLDLECDVLQTRIAELEPIRAKHMKCSKRSTPPSSKSTSPLGSRWTPIPTSESLELVTARRLDADLMSKLTINNTKLEKRVSVLDKKVLELEHKSKADADLINEQKTIIEELNEVRRKYLQRSEKAKNHKSSKSDDRERRNSGDSSTSSLEVLEPSSTGVVATPELDSDEVDLRTKYEKLETQFESSQARLTKMFETNKELQKELDILKRRNLDQAIFISTNLSRFNEDKN